MYRDCGCSDRRFPQNSAPCNRFFIGSLLPKPRHLIARTGQWLDQQSSGQIGLPNGDDQVQFDRTSITGCCSDGHVQPTQPGTVRSAFRFPPVRPPTLSLPHVRSPSLLSRVLAVEVVVEPTP
ncbi:unnamed protein product [Protopolystoma xenopodis]|uniref:Uncharacterized protein n=1 Tax=Protopolystoma xenopodis TaxID=117903 RepID=A0A3S5BKC1_9PLAT|nr:unnamed protein product [Protopolystoma xenopodis]